MKKTLGIIGGMGPLATVKLFNKIVLLTEAGSDQEHLDIIVYNKATIPDRTQFLKGDGENPTQHLVHAAQQLEIAGADYLVMPCNAAHFFFDEIVKNISIPFISMIKETVNYVARECSQLGQVGILATEGTIMSKIYDEAFGAKGIEVVKPSYEDQAIVSNIIYNIKKSNSKIDIKEYERVINKMENDGVELFILGCTELSVAYEMLSMDICCIDPLEVIAVSSIEQAGKKVKYDMLRTLKKEAI